MEGEHHFTGVLCQGDELPSTLELGKWSIHQLKRNEIGVFMMVARGERLLQAGKGNRDGCLHAVLVTMADRRPTTPGHELRVFLAICHQVKHLVGSIGNQDGALYGMHR